ncbi:MAG: sirohydrochlorin cobaltochelatase [Gudongella sp.]|nr:sirohydrochlorin cobaltochelatase [Gudongella sp.]
MKKGIIVASFGTTHQDTRERTIDVIENAIRKEFPDFSVIRAFTSDVVMRRLRDNHGIDVFSLEEAMEQLVFQGVTDIYIQPLHIIGGIEFEKVLRAARDFMKNTGKVIVRVGTPLMWEDRDFRNIVRILTPKDDTPVVLVGHGSRHKADSSYERLAEHFERAGIRNVYIGTLEGKTGLEDMIGYLKEGEHRELVLKPFMLVAGDHAKNDMASEDEDSWSSILEGEGFNVRIEMTPLGEIEEIQGMFVTKMKEVIMS